MKRPVWRYREEAVTNAPLAVLRAALEAQGAAARLSVCARRLAGAPGGSWRLASCDLADTEAGGLRLAWTAVQGGLAEEASLAVEPREGGFLLRAEGRLRGWPLLWKVGLLGWRSESLLQRFVAGL